MATPYKRKDSPFYWADVWQNGRKRSISLKTQNYGMARALLHERLASLQRGGLQLPTRTPVGEIVDRFVLHLQATGRPKAAQTDAYRLREFFGDVGELMKSSATRRARSPHADAQSTRRKTEKTRRVYGLAVRVHFVEEVNTAMVNDFLVSMRNARGLDPKTVNEYREILHRFFTWAIRQQGIRLPGGEPRTNPVADVRRLKTADPSIRFIRTIAEIHRQIEVLAGEPQLQAMVAVLIYAGLRRSEMLHLTRDDVELDRRRILVRRKTVDGIVYQPKTGRNRAVPISEALHAHLQEYHPPAGKAWYFPSPEGCLWDGDNFGHRLAKINKGAGLEWGSLDFRHTFGSHLAMKGESLYKIATLMGNSPGICQRHYACLLPESLVGSVEFDYSETPPPRVGGRAANVQAEAARPRLRLVREPA